MHAKLQVAVEQLGVELIPVAHAVPHVAQLLMSDCRLRHTPPQFESEPPQHTPERQVSPVPQELPHAPQFAFSVWRLRHAVPHAV